MKFSSKTRLLILLASSLVAATILCSFDLGPVPLPKVPVPSVPALPAVPVPQAAPAAPAPAAQDSKLLQLGQRSLDTATKANEDLTPTQQYYLGRAFSATILQTKKPADNTKANHYLNQIGQALALAAEQPDTYSGYRFELLDTPEINAFSGPGGFILVTKGLVKLTHNEAELAAVLAHEIGHVALEHGVKAIQTDRKTGAVVSIGADVAKTVGPDQAKDLTAAFEGSVTDLTKTIVDKGYSRETEFEADARACTVLRRAGYSPKALLSMLQELGAAPQGTGPSITKTHPSPKDRITQATKLVAGDAPVKLTPVQDQRYHAALDGI